MGTEGLDERHVEYGSENERQQEIPLEHLMIVITCLSCLLTVQ